MDKDKLSMIPDGCTFLLGRLKNSASTGGNKVYRLVDSKGEFCEYTADYVKDNFEQLRICNAKMKINNLNEVTLYRIDSPDRGITPESVIEQYKLYKKSTMFDEVADADKCGKLVGDMYDGHRFVTDFNNDMLHENMKFETLEIVGNTVHTCLETRLRADKIIIHKQTALLALLRQCDYVECAELDLLEPLKSHIFKGILKTLKGTGIEKMNITCDFSTNEAAREFNSLYRIPDDTFEKQLQQSLDRGVDVLDRSEADAEGAILFNLERLQNCMLASLLYAKLDKRSLNVNLRRIRQCARRIGNIDATVFSNTSLTDSKYPEEANIFIMTYKLEGDIKDYRKKKMDWSLATVWD